MSETTRIDTAGPIPNVTVQRRIAST